LGKPIAKNEQRTEGIISPKARKTEINLLKNKKQNQKIPCTLTLSLERISTLFF
jgi:hypothetical protein